MPATPTTHVERRAFLPGSEPPLHLAIREAITPELLFDADAAVRDLEGVAWEFENDNTGYLSHDVHPYPAKFIPQVPGTLIARLSMRGDLILDPFGGSGTTALEAVRLGRRALIVDANPVGILAGKVKTCRLYAAVERDVHALRTSLIALYDNLPAATELLDRYQAEVPEIPNRSKWFSDQSCAELALIRASIRELDTMEAQNISLLAMSRIILKASFQDSETRYVSKPRLVEPGEILGAYLKALSSVFSNVQQTSMSIRYGVSTFVEADARNLPPSQFPDGSVDLIVTSPPYGNAMDYHLYHRFRLFWLGSDPRELAKIEIGSHLRHQKEASGHESYEGEMASCFEHIVRMLRPGRYAAFIVGDSIYEGTTYDGGEMTRRLGEAAGLVHLTSIQRQIHRTKRSFAAAGRRATSETIVIFNRPACDRTTVTIAPPGYKLWPYEDALRSREIQSLTGAKPRKHPNHLAANLTLPQQSRLKRVAFTSTVQSDASAPERTWQAVLENGYYAEEASRKDPKYVTHGLHTYKGKFYPQLGKALLNLAGVNVGDSVLDPFCGSGTTLLEAYLNGLSAHGCDMNPLAAKVAKAKVGILEVDPALVKEAVDTLVAKLRDPPRTFTVAMDQFPDSSHEEILAWFSPRVVAKLNWLLRAVRSVSAGVLRDFFEVLVSDNIREVSHQEPSDLRIRRRKEQIEDADLLGLFSRSLASQFGRLEKFWSVRGYCPFPFFPATAVHADSREWNAYSSAGVQGGQVDVILTSPPYATALPYIDTDRLSLLVLFGLNAQGRRPLERDLTGSREIGTADRRELEERLMAESSLPRETTAFLQKLHRAMQSSDVGFRRRNMPALLYRYFEDMRAVICNAAQALKPGGHAFIVMGDNLTSTPSREIEIPTTSLLIEVAEAAGLKVQERIPITVTTENMVHVKHSIRENSVVWLRR